MIKKKTTKASDFSYSKYIAIPDHKGIYIKTAKYTAMGFVLTGFVSTLLLFLASLVYDFGIFRERIAEAVNISALSNLVPAVLLLLMWPSMKEMYMNERSTKRGVGQKGLFLRLVWSACCWVSGVIPALFILIGFVRFFT